MKKTLIRQAALWTNTGAFVLILGIGGGFVSRAAQCPQAAPRAAASPTVTTTPSPTAVSPDISDSRAPLVAAKARRDGGDPAAAAHHVTARSATGADEAAAKVSAAERIDYAGRPRYADGQLSIRAGAGVTKYIGEYTDETASSVTGVTASYALQKYIDVGAHFETGKLTYNRRERRGSATAYTYNFDDNLVPRETPYWGLDADIRVNLLPTQFINVYALAGVGMTFFTPQDYVEGTTQVVSHSDPGLSTLNIPVGAGMDVYLTRRWAMNFELRNNFTDTKELDAFPSDVVRDMWYAEQGLTRKTEAAATANDSYLTFALGVKYHFMDDTDFDDDGLTNTDEDKRGTNPYDPDTDGDGLRDLEEVNTTQTSPLLTDTDGDGLNDFVEVMKYHTRADAADTDGDEVGDKDEILVHNINPLVADTDGDGLDDADELLLGSNPNVVDTDRDGIYDGEEVRGHRSDPLLPDTDGEGLTDYDEVFRYKTDPLKADEDGDGLTDFEEVKMTGTNPHAADTDGDGLSDYQELRVTGSNPLLKDTDEDGINDDADTCPREPETFNGFQDRDGCPDSPARNR